ncbi:hypothetical protein AVEN_192752-1 [Araneus ventricosus]|uniref:Uncharacterized protein n=1 Tax=Araneus ventricosus TaxID=182803 RepID=A0A4Y2EPY0_ARAVE|nr:hypothetical protein AVEN_192752-1 [Araneus ventricosus]
MAMVRKFGRPDLFVTFTCNPSCLEILNAMQGRERPESRPDIVPSPHATKLNHLSIELNNAVWNLIPGREEVSDSINYILNEDQLSYPEEILNSLTPTGMPPYKLRLKKAAVIMLLQNLMSSKGPVHRSKANSDKTTA